MPTKPWWQGAVPHASISSGQVNEALFEAKLGDAILGRGPEEYRDAATFFAKTFLTTGLRGLLLDVLHTLAGQRVANVIINLKTSFGGGKSHTELAIYHLFSHPVAAMTVPQVRELVAEAGLVAPPPCRVAVLPCTRIAPAGRKTDDDVYIRTLWGEMAYLLGGKAAFDLVAESDRQLVSPGEATLEAVLQLAGPSLILFDETLHYVDKVSSIKGPEGDLAKQTVAFLRELTAVVDALPRNMLVVSLTASRQDQLSNNAQIWLQRMERHVNRLARPCTPIEGTEIHEVVRRRLFDHVDTEAAQQTASEYHRLYMSMGGLPAQYVDEAYRGLILRSYPFHPELITLLYERWGAKPGFQLTRGTLRFLALALQELWQRRHQESTDLIQMGHISVTESNVRAMVREIAGDPQWESVMGSDVAAPRNSEQKAKAELIDTERNDGQGLARALATTILLYSVGGGEHPQATRQEIRLSCARHGIDDAAWDDLLLRFRRRLFYLYYDDANYQFRKEPNVTSLHNTYRVNIGETSEVDAYLNKILIEKALGDNSPMHGFSQVYYLPNRMVDRDDDQLKLVVLGLDQAMQGDDPGEAAMASALGILDRHGQVLRQHRNTLVFCAPSAEATQQAREFAADYLSWRKIQLTAADWDRIGGAQQALVKEQLEETESATRQAVTRAYSWALTPVADPEAPAKVALKATPLGIYGPGKLVAPMVWESLTAKVSGSQFLLKELMPATLLERYGAQVWPEAEKWVTTTQLWERFTSQVGLPILVKEQALLDTLRQGQYEGLLAIGLLVNAQSPRHQRDSYTQLHFKEVLPQNVPLLGERWVVMRPPVYRQIAEQPEHVTAADVALAIEELGNGEHPVSVKAVHKVVATNHRNNIDEESFRSALVAFMKESGVAYRTGAQESTTLPTALDEVLDGLLVKKTGPAPAVKQGRTIVIQGALQSINEMAPFFKKILQPVASQQPAELSIEVRVSAHFQEDPGSGLDAALDDGFDNGAFPGLTRVDSRG